MQNYHHPACSDLFPLCCPHKKQCINFWVRLCPIPAPLTADCSQSLAYNIFQPHCQKVNAYASSPQGSIHSLSVYQNVFAARRGNQPEQHQAILSYPVVLWGDLN